MKAQQPKLCFGTVLSFDERCNRGKVEISGEKDPVPFSLETERSFGLGVSTPVFLDYAPQVSPLPVAGSSIVAMLGVQYDQTRSNIQRTITRRPVIIAWTNRLSYEVARQAILARPVYEVWEYALHNGLPNGQKRVARGTVFELEEQSPRWKANDLFAPEWGYNPITIRRRFVLAGKQVPDPRPLPAGMFAERFIPTNELGMYLAKPEEIAPINEAFLPSWAKVPEKTRVAA